MGHQLVAQPDLNCLQAGEAPPRRLPFGALLQSDQEKLTTLPPSGERPHPTSTCHALQKHQGTSVSSVGCTRDPFLSKPPQKWFRPLWGPRSVDVCVTFCFKLHSSRTCPHAHPFPSEELREGQVCPWMQRRMTGCSAARPSASTHGILAGATPAT